MNSDSIFFDIERQLSFYNRLVPLNRKEEKKRFFGSASYNPVFKYKPPADKSQKVMKRTRELKIESSSPAAGFYRRLKKETLLKCRLIENMSNPEKFTCLSKDIFGIPGKEEISFARQVLSGGRNDFREPVTAGEIKKSIEDELNKSGIGGWKIILKKNMPSKMSIKAFDNSIHLNSSSGFFPRESERLIVHEIRVHLYRALNGARQKWGIFKRGTAGYSETEEGLAVFFETTLNCCPTRQMKIYAGRLMAVSFAVKNSFRKSFNSLSQWFPEELAYRFTERAKRGLTDTSFPGALTKDIHYISGYIKIKDIQNEKDFPETLFAGKINLREREEVANMIKQGLLLPPAYLPYGNS